MTRSRFMTYALGTMALTVLLLGCGSEATEPAPVGPVVPERTEVIEVSVTARGLGPQPTAYEILVDGAPRGGVAPGAVFRLQLARGRRTISFRTPPAHCSIADDVREVEVVAGGTPDLDFLATCRGGALRVVTATSDNDAAHEVELDVQVRTLAWASRRVRVAVPSEVLVERLPADATVDVAQLTPLSHCRGGAAAGVGVVDGDTVEVRLPLACDALPRGGILFGLRDGRMLRRLDDGRVFAVGVGRDPVWAADAREILFVADNLLELEQNDGSGPVRRWVGGIGVARSAGAGRRPIAPGEFANPGEMTVGGEVFWTSRSQQSATSPFVVSHGSQVFRAPTVATTPRPPAVAFDGPSELGSAVLLPDGSGVLTSSGHRLVRRPFGAESPEVLVEMGESPWDMFNPYPPGDIVVRQLPQPLRLSPNGRAVLYSASCLHYMGYMDSCGAYVVPLDGSPARRVAELASGLDWSPDGSRLLMRLGKRVFTVRASDGGDEQPLAELENVAMTGSWSR